MGKYTSYVDPFQGNGEISLPVANAPAGELAATWFFVKAQCGNTFPHAALPFSAMTVGAYSGAYSTGYGKNLDSYCGAVPKMYDKKVFCGLSHLHHSGTGAVGFYYNYALTAPFFGQAATAFEMCDLLDECAHPGYYAATKAGSAPIRCEATVTQSGTALHRYTFSEDGGRIAIDLGNDGLLVKNMRAYSAYASIDCLSKDSIAASVELQGVRLHFSIKCRGAKGVRLFEENSELDASLAKREYSEGFKGRFGVIFDVEGRAAEISLGISMVSVQRAQKLRALGESVGFDEAVNAADQTWDRCLGAVEIEADDSTKRVFYSNLYHSIIKPVSMRGDSFIYQDGEDAPFMADFTTLWDIYKTQLPLVFALYRDEGCAISYSLTRICETLGHSPNTISVTNRFDTENKQARALTTIALMTAHVFGCDGLEAGRILDAMLTDIFNERNDDFLKTGFCRLYTHILDLTDACASAGELASELSRSEDAERLKALAVRYVNAYDTETGLLSAKSDYYEGGLHNYSFRLCHDHEGRAALAGGRERYAQLLADFFGYGKPAVRQPSHDDGKYIADGIALGRFEGFNNEPDMETPYACIYAGRHDMTCEVIHSGMQYMYCAGEGGIPGNNDSGGLSSCYIWDMIGIFPEAGRDRMLIGSPSIRKTILHTSGGRDFEIDVRGEGIYVRRALLNGQELDNMYFKASALIKGGRLEIELAKEPQKG